MRKSCVETKLVFLWCCYRDEDLEETGSVIEIRKREEANSEEGQAPGESPSRSLASTSSNMDVQLLGFQDVQIDAAAITFPKTPHGLLCVIGKGAFGQACAPFSAKSIN